MNRHNFEQTALPHMTVLHTYAIHLTMNSENAKDLLQETYLKTYRFWGNFENGTNIKAWLYCIMKNSFINLYRKETREPKKVEYKEYHLPYNTIQETSFAHKHMIEKSYDEIFGDEIARSLESLNDSFRNILILSDIEGLSYEEIANTIDCPIGTVRSRLHRGRKLLKKKLFNYARDNRYIPKGAQCKDFVRTHVPPKNGNIHSPRD
ncbi:MAG: sigma-70 family RNA polymerase sigma factor [Bacteroidota bacterium]